MIYRRLYCFGILSTLFANPQNPVVVHGQASFSTPAPETFEVRADHHTILNWKDFSIKAGETTRFIQPNANSAVLNRVTGGNLSAIMGKLEANGKVFLINPAGVLVGKDAVINTASFAASTLDALDSDFLNDLDIHLQGDSRETIINLGKICADSGDVYLVGYQVENQGTIEAPQGSAGLGAGLDILIQFKAQEKIAIRPKMEGGALLNSGSIEALAAEMRTDGTPYALAINHSGSTKAFKLEEKGGRVFLSSGQGQAEVSGELVAKGGEVRVLGDEVALVGNSKIDVSDEAGGGIVLIGGGFQGKENGIQNSHQTVVEKDVQIFADGLGASDGGHVILWSDGNTHFNGSISVQGGNEGGDGGFVEVSGKQFLDFKGTADRRASHGKVGTLLLDPTSLIISSAADFAVTANSPFEPNPATNAATASKLSTAGGSNFLTALSMGNVIIQTTNDGGNNSGDILWEIDSDVTNGNNTSLTINSVRDFIMYSKYEATNSLGNFTAQAERDIIITSPTTITTSTQVGPVVPESVTLNAKGSIYANADYKKVIIKGGTNTGLTGATTLIAGQNIVASGGSTANASVDIIGNNETGGVFLTAGQDILITGGTNMGCSVAMGSGPTYLRAGGDLMLNAISGPVSMSAQQMTLNVDGNTILSGGGLPNASASITGFSQFDGNFGGDVHLHGGIDQSTYALMTTNDGNMDIKIGGNLQLYGGANDLAYAQIGGQAYPAKPINCNITFDSVAGSVIVQGGTYLTAYAQIGNNGDTSVNGNIDFTAGIGANLTVDAQSSYAQIGHSMTVAQPIPLTGNIRINSVGNDITIGTLNSGHRSVIGHGSMQQHYTTSQCTGDISLSNIGGSIYLPTGQDFDSLGRIGHYDALNLGGNIRINKVGNDIYLNPSRNGVSSAQIGHANGENTISGDISLNDIGGTIYVTGLSGLNGNGYGIIGHNSSGNPNISGNIRINNVSNDILLMLIGDSFAEIGHYKAINVTGNISIDQIGGNIYLTNNGFGGPTQIGHAGIWINQGNIQISNVQNDIFLDASIGSAPCQIGHYLQRSNGFLIGDIFLTDLGGSLHLISGKSIPSFVQVGHGGYFTRNLIPAISGNIRIANVGNDISLNSFAQTRIEYGYYASIGHGGPDPLFIFARSIDGDISLNQIGGNISLTGSALISVSGGKTIPAPSQIGHAGSLNIVGNIDLADITGNINLISYCTDKSSTVFNTAQIGHISSNLKASVGALNIEGDISIQSTNGDVLVFVDSSSMAQKTCSSQIGHFTVGWLNDISESITGNISLNLPNGSLNVVTENGVLAGSYAQLGHFGIYSSALAVTGDIFVNLGLGDIHVVSYVANGAIAYSNNAIIGHAGSTLGNNGEKIDLSGDIWVQSELGNVNLEIPISPSIPLTPALSFVQLGHVIFSSPNDALNSVEGDIAIRLMNGNLSVQAGSDGLPVIGQSAVVGHGNYNTSLPSATAQGNINVNATSVSVTAGLNPFSDGVIGFAGVKNVLDNSSVSVNAQGNVFVNGQPGDGNAVIGYFNPQGGHSISIHNVDVNSANANVFINSSKNATFGTGVIGVYDRIGMGNFDTTVTINANKSVVLSTANPPAIISGPDGVYLNAGLNLSMDSLITTMGGGGEIVINAKRDLIMINNAQITAANGDVMITVGKDITMNNTSSINGGGEITTVAGRNTFLNDTASMTTSGVGPINIVVDNMFLDLPKFGVGHLNTAAGTKISTTGVSGAVRLFTARQNLNSLNGMINGSSYVPGTVYLDTNEEVWGRYYYTSFNGVPFTVFYKDFIGAIPIPPRPTSTPPNLNSMLVNGIMRRNKAVGDVYRDWETLGEFYTLDRPYGVSYDWQAFMMGITPAYHSCQAIEDEDYVLIRRTYRTYTNKKYEHILLF